MENNSDIYLFFDTETTGLPKNWRGSIADVDNWPRLVQLSWIMTDAEGNTIKEQDYIIRPEGFIIPPAASNVHGITTEKAMTEGGDKTEILREFWLDVAKSSYVIGHNVRYDINVVSAEIFRECIDSHGSCEEDKFGCLLNKKGVICTMESSKDYCQLQPMNSYGYKAPKLQELHEKLFGNNFDNAHNSMADTAATKECFWEMKRLNLTMQPPR